MLLFEGAAIDFDMQRVWTKYTGINPAYGFDIAIQGNFLIRMEFKDGFFGPKINFAWGWNVETGEKENIYMLDLDDKKMLREMTKVSGNHKALLRVIHIAAGEYNLGDAELNEGLRQAVTKNDIPFHLTRVPLTRG